MQITETMRARAKDYAGSYLLAYHKIWIGDLPPSVREQLIANAASHRSEYMTRDMLDVFALGYTTGQTVHHPMIGA